MFTHTMTRSMTRAELDELANLLAEHGGALPSALWGFVVAAITSGNQSSDWIPDVLRGDDPRTIELLERFGQDLRDQLARGRFSWPSSREDQIEWCGGYMRYVDDDPVFNSAADSAEIQKLLFPIALAGGYLGFEVEPGYRPEQIIDDAISKVPDSIAGLYWWFERLLTAPPKPKAGRNDPCPCGSGKKYKRCCLN